MYLKPDRSDQSPNFSKSNENEAIDIGWNEGFLSDGRSYRAECWADNQVTMLTFFFSTTDMEDYTEEMFLKFLDKQGLVQFVTKNPHIAAVPVTDASGNDMWSVNVVIGTEDGLKAKDSVSLRAYKKTGT